MFSTISSSSSSSSSSTSISPNRDLSSLAPPEVLQQMIQLTNPQAPQLPLCSDPQIFFEQFGIDTRIFRTQDVELLQHIFQTLKFHPDVCLFDIFGLKFHLLLKELKDSFSIELPAELIQEWHGMYLQAYLNLFRESPATHLPERSAAFRDCLKPKKYYSFLIEFTNKLTSHTNRKLSEKLSNQKSTKLHTHFQKGVHSILAEWDSLQKLLGKCLILKNPSLILCDLTLNKTPGAEQMRPESLEGAQQAARNLYYYLEMISAAHDENLSRKWIGLHSLHLKEILKELKPFSYLKNSQDLLKHAKKCLTLISQKLPLLQKSLKDSKSYLERSQNGELSYEMWCAENKTRALPQKKHEFFLEDVIQRHHQSTLELCWLTDCQKVLEESIIAPLDCSFYTMRAYENRIYDNLTSISQDMFLLLTSSPDEQMFSEKTELQKQMYFIKGDFYFCFQNLSEELQSLYFSLQSNYGNLIQDKSSLDRIVSKTKLMLSIALKELYKNINPGIRKGEPLLQELLWLCRIFIFVHDINYITEATTEQNESDIFPDDFLQFLALEDEAEPAFEPFASTGASIESGRDFEEELFSLEPLQLDQPASYLASNPSAPLSYEEAPIIAIEDLESRLSAASLIYPEPLQSISVSSAPSQSRSLQASSSAKGKKKSKDTPRKKETPQIRPLESQPRFPQAIDPRVLLEVKKRRQVEKILTQLGLKPIRTKGSHTVWQHTENPNIQTVVPHHPEIARGTRNAIFEQITGEDA